MNFEFLKFYFVHTLFDTFLYLTKGCWIFKISENFIEHLNNGIILVQVRQWFCFSCWLMFLLGNIYWSYGKMILTNDDIVNKSRIQEPDKYRPLRHSPDKETWHAGHLFVEFVYMKNNVFSIWRRRGRWESFTNCCVWLERAVRVLRRVSCYV